MDDDTLQTWMEQGDYRQKAINKTLGSMESLQTVLASLTLKEAWMALKLELIREARESHIRRLKQRIAALAFEEVKVYLNNYVRDYFYDNEEEESS